MLLKDVHAIGKCKLTPQRDTTMTVQKGIVTNVEGDEEKLQDIHHGFELSRVLIKTGNF